MIRATKVQGQHRWKQAAADTVVLDFDDRHRRRMAMAGTRGLEFLLDLETAVALRGGDALVLEDGRLIEVVAAPEPLLEIRGTDPHHLVRVAWHLGNRHLPTQIMAKGLRIRRDHVIEAMVRGLGARVIEIEAPFDPEGGAYAESQVAHDDHGHGHNCSGHDHAHHDHAHQDHAAHDQGAGRVHDAHCGHDHGAAHVHDEHCGHDHDSKHGHSIPMRTTTNSPQGTAVDTPLPHHAAEDGLAAGEGAALYRLMTWLSPAFPVGAFSYSSGIEWAVEAGDITDAGTLQAWLSSMLKDGAGFCDGIFLVQAHRAIASGNDTALRELAEFAAAFVPSRERQLETTSQGRAFIEIARNAWNCDGLERLIAVCEGATVYPVAVGIVSAAHGVPIGATLHGFLHAVVSNWISAGARLVPLGQTDSQRVLAAFEPVVVATGIRVLNAGLDDLGSATFRADIAGMRHETQYTRLFRS